MSEVDDRKAAIRARLDAATPGPWEYVDGGAEERQVFDTATGMAVWIADDLGTNIGNNGSFIANAPADIEFLLSLTPTQPDRDARDAVIAANAWDEGAQHTIDRTCLFGGDGCPENPYRVLSPGGEA